MTIVVEHQQYVDPARLLVVDYRDRAGVHSVLAIACRYVPAIDAAGRRAVALEVLVDPAVPAPMSPYYATPQQLQQLLLDPRGVTRIRPYVSG